MSRKKEILAAGYFRDILFQSKDDLELYIYQLQHRYQNYKILEQYNREDGSVIIRIAFSSRTTTLL